MAVEYVFVGDDFTGASDTLATLARAGRRVRLFLDPPDPEAIAEERLDAVGIATEFRALPPNVITTQIETMAPGLRALSPRIVHYKICSTFDSSREVGSIGAAVTALEHHLAPELVAIIGGQPSLGRYCAFGNLFARGPNGQVDRIDRHPVMRRHPITPMTEADLRIHLARQDFQGLQLVAWPTIEEGPAALKAHIEGLLRAGQRHMLFDACNQAHLDTIGAALDGFGSNDRPLLIIGASSVAEALASAPRPHGPVVPARDNGNRGPCLVVAGSRSEVTAAQVEAARRFNRVPIRSQDLANETTVGQFAARCAAALATDENVLAYLTPSENYRSGGAELSHKLADLVAATLDRHAVRALGIAGGDTSSVVVRRLGFDSLAFEEQLDTGVAICVAGSNVVQRNDMRLMLKGGQVGSDAVFDRFVSAMDGRCR
ncbi:Hrp-dependent type III effector protein [Phyllobacterium phragmitis]|uniref:Hrp-dependent type III effector protein n=1 Tax=Phyllobacterium phragmitis TaxID=2670329 RepID=A0A2S9IW86_9HYPH|nr:four-carbon acid sugar kinase family protein [Phyllobacterium phragmitis]PRD44778.1 Hrp-dependent type III effector protein [Phyllobacterium phragmitis]